MFTRSKPHVQSWYTFVCQGLAASGWSCSPTNLAVNLFKRIRWPKTRIHKLSSCGQNFPPWIPLCGEQHWFTLLFYNSLYQNCAPMSHVNLLIGTHSVAAGHSLVHSSIHSSEANSALGLLLDSCGCSCPLRLQAVYNRRKRRLRKTDDDKLLKALNPQ